MQKKILFISHEASETGAVKFLLMLQMWLKKNSNFNFETLILKNGPLLDKFKEINPVITIEKNLLQKIKNKLNKIIIPSSCKYLQHEINKIKRKKFDIIYSNTITNGHLYPEIATLGAPIITHVHELNSLTVSFGEYNLKNVIKYSSNFIAASYAVQNDLIEKLSINADSINTFNTFINTENLPTNSRGCVDKNKLLSSLGISSNSYIIGCCGYIALHKGTDLLPLLAMHLPKQLNDRQIHFIHLGKSPDTISLSLLKRDVEILGLSNRVHFLNHQSNSRDWISIFDVHALLSREETLSIVMLEAADYGIPTVCFKQSGGAPYFCNNGNGLSVDYLNIQEMADSIKSILQNESYRKKMGSNANKLLKNQYSADSVMPKLIRYINNKISSA